MDEFGNKIIDWYSLNKRDLPWRNTKNPYLIWLSEIILQQTRVVQGLPYFEKFKNRYPTVKDLASANQDEILGLWKGLGYYSRARNLLKAAKQINETHNGNFPNNFKELKKIIGIGDYTAAAIASFAFQETVPVVDGNVYRVLSRYFLLETPIDTGNGKKEFFQLASELIKNQPPDTFNQSIMEFGALVCTPKNPNCNSCILNDKCEAFNLNKTNELPFKSKKIKKKNRYMIFLIHQKNDKIGLTKRDEKEIWAGMYQLPLIELKDLSLKDIKEQLANQKMNVKTLNFLYLENQKHILTHQNIYYNCIFVEETGSHQNIEYFKKEMVQKLGVPKLVENALDKIFNQSI